MRDTIIENLSNKKSPTAVRDCSRASIEREEWMEEQDGSGVKASRPFAGDFTPRRPLDSSEFVGDTIIQKWIDKKSPTAVNW
jgi:hypothetical protein